MMPLTVLSESDHGKRRIVAEQNEYGIHLNEQYFKDGLWRYSIDSGFMLTLKEFEDLVQAFKDAFLSEAFKNA